MLFDIILLYTKGLITIVILENSIDTLFSAKEIFSDIRNFLAGRLVGATRDEILLQELIKIIFCHREGEKSKEEVPSDQFGLAEYYRKIFDNVKIKFPEIFNKEEQIMLDPVSISYIHEKLNLINVFDLERDAIGDAYEIFIGESIKGQSGQFFTPRNATNTLINMVQPKPTDKILDFACGAGGFLISTLNFFNSKNYSKDAILNSIKNMYGIDKDEYLTKLAKIHISSMTDTVPNIKLADSLVWDLEHLSDFPDEYDIIFSNPPFGSKINAGTPDTLGKFDLAYKWKNTKGTFFKTENLNLNVAPQVLFMELAIKKVKSGGSIGIVVPESLLSSKKYAYVVNYILTHCKIKAVIGMSEELFKISGKGGTHTKTALLVLEKRGNLEVNESNLFLAEAKWVGNDSRGKKIEKDDLPTILEHYLNFTTINQIKKPSSLGYAISSNSIENYILSPRYYNLDIISQTVELQETHSFIKIEQLLDEGVIEFKTGHEVGKTAYGTGEIPFVRTSDISNWEIKSDPKQAISRAIYDEYKVKQDIQIGDLLMVRDGTYLIGTTAIITKYDLEMVYQSHLYKIRLFENKYGITPYYLLALLSSTFVQNQIFAKTFTQDIINSLGDRYKDLILPIQKNRNDIERISKTVEQSIHSRIEARELARQARIDILR